MGVHTGEVERIDDDYRGRPVNRAARIMAVGHGGQVLLSDVTASLVRSSAATAVELVDVGTHRLRGVGEPERLWQVVHPDLDRVFPPLRTSDAAPASLPAPRSSLVGRDRDAQRIVALLSRERVVTLTGVGGVGKTRLAIRAASESTAGFGHVWFVALASTTDPDDVVAAVALAIGAGGSTGSPLAAIRGIIGTSPALLVIDNCEHVIEAASAVVDELTTACTELRVLATSREALGIDGEQVVAVRPLDIPTAAVELFRQRAAAAGAAVGDRHRDVVEALCSRLDGLPLAIELAAARAATLGVAGIVDALDDPALLRSARRDADDRHCTMRATIEWSYRLLDPQERQLLRWLGVFVGGFELDAVQHVAAQLGIGVAVATRHLESLVQKSMIATDGGPDGVRFRMLETMRAFTAEQLDTAGERSAARAALAAWMVTIAGHGVQDPCSAAVERNSIRLEREADNWREAVLYAVSTGAGELAAGLCGPPADFFLLGRHDLADVVRPLLACCTEPHQRAAVLSALIVSAAGGTDPALLGSLAAEVAAIDEARSTDRPASAG